MTRFVYIDETGADGKDASGGGEPGTAGRVRGRCRVGREGKKRALAPLAHF